MTEYTLTLLDTVSIQPYIFASNRLQEIIGASELVVQATGDWAYDELNKVCASRHNITDLKTGARNPTLKIEDPQAQLDAEVIYAAGGNMALLFRDFKQAKAFTRQLTSRVLKDAPGLNLVVAHTTIAWEKNDLGRQVGRTIEEKLAARKLARNVSMPLPGLGVTAACSSTGGVAAGTPRGLKLPYRDGEDGNRLISRETAAKLDYCNQGNQRLEKLLRKLKAQEDFEFPRELDQLGRQKDRESYIAVVHADGNSMGSRVQQIGKDPGDNRSYIQRMREFSDSVALAGENALLEVISQVIRLDRQTSYTQAEYLPFRPLIYGGDDVTFVCQGNLGAPLAALYLEVFEKQKLGGVPVEQQQPYACAGVCVVKSHYPFARAYQLSEELCRSAKRMRLEGEDFSALDWHFAASGVSGDLGQIRREQYQIEKGRQLTLRPVRLHAPPFDQDGRAWYERVEKLVQVFQESPEWKGRRNKVKALRDALRQGELAVEKYLLRAGTPRLPELVPDSLAYRENGFYVGRCGYFDAIELLDHYRKVG